jgi:hypothetical protein
MYLHEALKQSDKVRNGGNPIAWTVDDNIPGFMAINDKWEPVLTPCSLVEASKKWKKFRRLGWLNEDLYLYFVTPIGPLRAGQVNHYIGDCVYLRLEDIQATDWVELKE